MIKSKSLTTFESSDTVNTGRIQIGIRTRCQANVNDSMTINRISTGRMALIFSFYFNFNINVLANIW